MSIKAHIIRSEIIWVDEKDNVYRTRPDTEKISVKEFEHKDQEECFKPYRQNILTDTIMDYGGEDYTNDKGTGTIEIVAEDFERLYKNERFANQEDNEAVEMMKKYFDEGHWILVLDCW